MSPEHLSSSCPCSSPSAGFETAGQHEFRPRRWSARNGGHTSADPYAVASPGKSIRAELHPEHGPARLVETGVCGMRRNPNGFELNPKGKSWVGFKADRRSLCIRLPQVQ